VRKAIEHSIDFSEEEALNDSSQLLPLIFRYQRKLFEAVCIKALVVKYLDRFGTSGGEGVLPVYLRQSRTKVWGAKTIRYRCSPLL